MVVVQGLLLVAVAFMVLDTMFALSDVVSPESAPSKAREGFKIGLGMGGGEEEDEAEKFWKEEQEIVEDFSQVEDALSDIESAEYDLESEFEAYKSYISEVNQLRIDIAHDIENTDFDSLEHRYQFVKFIRSATGAIADLHGRYEESNPVHNVYDALLSAVEDRIDDLNNAVDDLRDHFRKEINVLQEALQNIEEDQDELDADDIKEIDRENLTQRNARDIINTNNTEISQLRTTDQKLDRIEEELEELKQQNESIKDPEEEIDEIIQDINTEVSKLSSTFREAKSGDDDEKEAFEENLDRIIASFYGEDPSRLDQLQQWVKDLVTDVDSNKPPLLEKWDEMINRFDNLQSEHSDLVEKLNEVETELANEEKEHHKA